MFLIKCTGLVAWTSFRLSKKVLDRAFTNSALGYNKQANQGLVIGVYGNDKDAGSSTLSEAAQEVDTKSGGQISKLLNLSDKPLKKGKCKLIYNFSEEYGVCGVVGCGPVPGSVSEDVDQVRESVRLAVSAGVSRLRDEADCTRISVDTLASPEAAAEASHLCLHTYDELKEKSKRKSPVTLKPYRNSDSVLEAWQRGCIKSEGQNLARHLAEMPSNLLTPRHFTHLVTERLANVGNINCIVRDIDWMRSQKMGAFLSVSQGSQEKPYLLEIHYKPPATDTDCKSVDTGKPFVLVGKGVTFDTGGISLKPPSNMDKMRGDMGGAASVCGALLSVAKLGIPHPVTGIIPLCENMPSGSALKPGDVVTAMNGKTIQVDNTDAEGRLILSDALCYAQTLQPAGIIDVATLTGAIRISLGSAVCGVFSNSNSLYKLLQKSGAVSGDRVWRMPLYEHYSNDVTECDLADVNNVGKSSPLGGSCTAAAFLKEFVSHQHWGHIDIAGVVDNYKGEVKYISKGMSGRPTRTLIEFLSRLDQVELDQQQHQASSTSDT